MNNKQINLEGVNIQKKWIDRKLNIYDIMTPHNKMRSK